MAAADKQERTKEELLEAVFSVRSVSSQFNDYQLSLRETLETAVRGVGCWCEMIASLQGRVPGSRETSFVGGFHPSRAVMTVTENSCLSVIVLCKIQLRVVCQSVQ
jgi:hypothetical protein